MFRVVSWAVLWFLISSGTAMPATSIVPARRNQGTRIRTCVTRASFQRLEQALRMMDQAELARGRGGSKGGGWTPILHARCILSFR